MADWRASGLTSLRFCEGREFTAGGLRHWSHKLRHGAVPAEKPVVRVARVLRASARTTGAPSLAPAPVASGVDVPVVVELGGARVALQRGFDRETLAAVLDVLASRGGAA